MSELKPCPFCGSDVSIEVYSNPYVYEDHTGKVFRRDEPDGYEIKCNHHGWTKDGLVAADIAMYSWNTSEKGKEELIAAWNARHEQTCKGVFKGTNRGFKPLLFCSECGTELIGKHCHECGRKVVE